MATFYLEVTSGGDVLAVDADTILAYQTGSVEGGGTTLVTITPTLEATVFGLPSDIGIFYKDSTSSTWLPSNATGRTFEVSLADGSYTYEAQLRYDADTPVTDENGAEVIKQTTTFTVGASSGTAPTFDATPAASATGPTVGDSVSVTSYAASGDPAPTVSFEWFVDAVSQAETTDTFDTTGLSGGETLTCTVTASNGVNPDATASVDFGTVAAAATANVTFSGTMTFNSSTRNNLTLLVQSGPDSADFTGRTNEAIRTTGTSTFIEYFFDVTGTPWADAAAFMAGTTNHVFTLTANGQQLANDNLLTSFNNTGTLVRPQLKVSSDSATNSAAISSFWGANMNDGSALVGDGSFEFTVSYDIVP